MINIFDLKINKSTIECDINYLSISKLYNSNNNFNMDCYDCDCDCSDCYDCYDCDCDCSDCNYDCYDCNSDGDCIGNDCNDFGYPFGYDEYTDDD